MCAVYYLYDNTVFFIKSIKTSKENNQQQLIIFNSIEREEYFFFFLLTISWRVFFFLTERHFQHQMFVFLRELFEDVSVTTPGRSKKKTTKKFPKKLLKTSTCVVCVWKMVDLFVY